MVAIEQRSQKSLFGLLKIMYYGKRANKKYRVTIKKADSDIPGFIIVSLHG